MCSTRSCTTWPRPTWQTPTWPAHSCTTPTWPTQVEEDLLLSTQIFLLLRKATEASVKKKTIMPCRKIRSLDNHSLLRRPKATTPHRITTTRPKYTRMQGMTKRNKILRPNQHCLKITPCQRIATRRKDSKLRTSTITQRIIRTQPKITTVQRGTLLFQLQAVDSSTTRIPRGRRPCQENR